MKRRRRGTRNPIPVALALLAVIVVGSYLAVTKDVPFVNDPYIIRAAFKDSNGIKKGSPVRIAGVQVGEVAKVEVTGKGKDSATLDLAIRDNGRPIKRDATATIRPRIFLEGNFFIELSPGRPQTAALDEGGMIPTDQTSNPVQLDQVLKALKSDVRADLRRTFAELSVTEANGGAKAFNRSLDYQPAAYKFSAIVSEALLGEKPGDLGRYISAQGAVAEALDRDPQALRDLITNFNRTTGALAERESDLRAAIRELPVTLRTALPTLASLNAAFPAVRRFSTAALPGIQSTPEAVDATLPLVRQLRGFVSQGELGGLSADLRRSTPPLANFAKTAVPLLGELRTLSSCTSETLVPFGNDTLVDQAFPAKGKVFQEIPKSLVGLAGESRSDDANGQWFKVLGTGGPETVNLGNGLLGTTTSGFNGVNPPPQVKRPPLMADAPCENQQIPDLRTIPTKGPSAVPIDASAPAVLDRLAQAQATAVEILGDQLRAKGDTTKVLNQAATREQVLEGIKPLKALGAGK